MRTAVISRVAGIFLSLGIQIKTGKPFETPSLFKNALLPFVNRRSSVQSGSPAPFFQQLREALPDRTSTCAKFVLTDHPASSASTPSPKILDSDRLSAASRSATYAPGAAEPYRGLFRPDLSSSRTYGEDHGNEDFGSSRCRMSTT